MKHSFYLPLLALLALFATMAPISASAAFGVSPPFINAEHMVAGARFVQKIFLVQDKPDQDLRIEAELDISDRARPWITIDKGFDFVIPRGVRQFPVEVTVQIPKGEGLGVYSGSLRFTSLPSETGQVTIALGVQVNINLTIGDDIYREFSIPVVRPLDIEEGWNPRVYVKFDNKGNVPESLEAATFELIDKFGGATLAYSQKQKGFPETPPFTVKEYVVEFPINFHLGLGQFWASVNFFKEGKVVASQRTTFNVLEKGSLSSPLEKIIRSLRDSWIYYAVALAIIFAVLFWNKRRKRTRREQSSY